MDYCYDCGCKLIIKYLENEGDIPYCPNCKKYVFPIFNTAVSMIIFNKTHDKVLFIQQYSRKANILVAGYVNKGEAGEDAVKREILEEVGLTVNHLCLNKTEYFPKSNTLLWNFIVEVNSMDFHRNESEVDLVKWFSISEGKEAILHESLAERFFLNALEKIKNGEVYFINRSEIE